MPKQKRWTIKRNMEQAVKHIDHAINNLIMVGSEFEGVHPEHYQAFCMIAFNLNQIKIAINELKALI
ncbi:hypothetical protein ES703_49788 [subsurface metagenome]